MNEEESPGIAVIVVAAGRGVRAGGDLPKQYRRIGGQPLLRRTLEAIAAAPSVGRIAAVIHPDDAHLYGDAAAGLSGTAKRKLIPPAIGAETRQGSVRAGLEELAKVSPVPQIVLIHDAARPFVSPALLERAIAAARTYGASVPATPVTDTIQEVDEDGRIVATPDRSRLRAVQTPQAFRFELILAAHRRAAAAGLNGFTDDGAVAAWAGHEVHIFEGELRNVKLTRPADFARAEEAYKGARDVRVAQGFDVHAFADGDHLWLAGVRIPHTHSLRGHSDADVVLHALTDALLGTIGDGDIGVHFPPSDPRWRAAASSIFLADAAARVRQRGGEIGHLDATIVCEAPKIGPYREAMRRRVAEIAGITLDRVGLKATTSEKLGFAGRGEGIAAFATATVRLPQAEDLGTST